MSDTQVTPVPEVDPLAPPSEAEAAAIQEAAAAAKAKVLGTPPLLQEGLKARFRTEEIAEAKMQLRLGASNPAESARALATLQDAARHSDDPGISKDAEQYLKSMNEWSEADKTTTPTKYTRAGVAGMSLAQFNKLKQNKAELARMKADLAEEEARGGVPAAAEESSVEPPAAEVVPDPAIAAAEAEAARVAQEAATAEAVRVAAEAEVARIKQAELDAAAAETARLAAEEAAKPKQKIVREYQIRDDQGRPIGKPTHLEADTWEEMSAKQEEAHANAMRYAERVKNRKPTPAPAPDPLPLTEEQLTQINKDLESANPATRAEATRKLVSDQLVKENQTMRQELATSRRTHEAQVFVNTHPEYWVMKANNDLLEGYIRDNNLAYTASNLEIAFEAILPQLAEKPKQVPTPAPAPPPPPIPVVAAATIPAAAAPVPVLSTPAPAPVVPTPAPAATPAAPAVPPSTNAEPEGKPPISGVQPGELTGVPAAPSSAPVASKRWTEKSFRDLPNAELKKRMKNPDFVTRVNEDLAYEREQKRKR